MKRISNHLNKNLRFIYLNFLFILLSFNAFSQQGFGDNLWNVNAYNDRNASSTLTTLPTNYRGYYTQNLDGAGNYGVNTELAYNQTKSPSSASNWSGNNVNNSNYTIIHKRKGFPSGNYAIIIEVWDDETYIFLDGVEHSFSGNNTWGPQNSAGVQTISSCLKLNANSTIEIRTGAGGTPNRLRVKIERLLDVNAGANKALCKGESSSLNGTLISSTPSTYTWTGGAIVSGANTLTPIVNPTSTTKYYLTATANGCSERDSVMVEVTLPTGDPSVFGENVWNVYGYNGENTDLSLNNYKGYYVQPSLSGENFGVSTQDFWSDTKSPSHAGTTIDNRNLWNGCDVNNDHHTFTHKRKGFPCGNYTFNMKLWDDETRVIIDGVNIWSCGVWSGGTGGYNNSNNSLYSCAGTTTFSIALDANSEVEIQTFERTGGSRVKADLIKKEPIVLTPNGTTTRTCRVKGNEWIDFLDENNQLIASINPNGDNLGEVTMTSFSGAPMVMEACGTPHPLYHTAYMGRRWVMNSDLYPNGSNYNNAVEVQLPFYDLEINDLNKIAETATPENIFDGGNTDPATMSNLMLTKITGPTEDGIATQADCASTIRGISNSGNYGTNIHSIANTQYVEFSIEQFSEFFLHKNNSGSPLPVTLTHFSAVCDNEMSIKWSTASETNSDYFSLEKSRDGENWLLVAEQTAAGNSNATINYNQIDTERWNGITYYRLQQVDINGDQNMYGPISVSCSGERNSLSVYPNPNNGSFTVEISSNETKSDVYLNLTDVAGKVITSQKVNISNGKTQIMIGDLGLQKGVYLISLKGKSIELKPTKVIVQ